LSDAALEHPKTTVVARRAIDMNRLAEVGGEGAGEDLAG